VVKNWCDISHLHDAAVIEQIRADSIDVLVDLSGHTKRSRLHVFARHPAPIQITWLGYLNTTGLTTIDYRICDRHTDPQGETDAFNAERLYRLPHSQWCYAPWYDVPEVMLPHGHCPNDIVFGSFNQYERISDECLDVWCSVLERVPHSRLQILDVRTPLVRDELLYRIALRGIDNVRIETQGREPIFDYFKAIGNVVIALDTWTYNGATTTLNTLWMGVPIVALRGHRGISRGTYSIMQSLSMPELIADSRDAYVDLNVRLAQEVDWRQTLRKTLRDRLRSSPLMDAPRFVADLEAGYRAMWVEWCRKAQ